MNIDNFDSEVLFSMLKDYFLYANKMMLIKNEECILGDISERFICASLKTEFDFTLKHTYFSKYYADVEYNRGLGKALKCYLFEDQVIKMTCDFILHSRGKELIDNLICLEMKKSNASEKAKDGDRKRLKCLTSPGGCEKVGNHRLIVRDYKLGIFYIVDSRRRMIFLEYYKHGELECKEELTFDQIRNYYPNFSFQSNV